jgi:hypothetical protein
VPTLTRVLFSVIDTPGLDFIEGRELKLERSVNAIIKYIDAQYADTMSEVRHVNHVCRLLQFSLGYFRNPKLFAKAKEINTYICDHLC